MSHARRRSIAFGVCALLMGVSLSACSYLPFGNTTHSTDLKVGQCIQVPDSSQVGSVVTTECTEEHTGEVYYISKITQDSLPSSSEMDELIAAACFDSFEDYVGTSPEETTLDATAMYPTSQTWSKGDRDIVCIAVPTGDEKLTESVRGSGK